MQYYTVCEPKLLPHVKERYDKVYQLYQLLKEPKETWYSSSKNNKTANLIMEIDVELFKQLSNMEKGIISQLSFTEKDLAFCFRNKNNKNFDKTKETAIIIYKSL
jgi:23S rRNA maturation mini-RNase III